MMRRRSPRTSTPLHLARVLPGLVTALLLMHTVHAVDPATLSNPRLEARYQVLIHQLRCVQCENNSLADSEVPIAGDLRRDIRGMLLAGKSDDQIRNYLVSRYSEFILFKPRYSWRNAWLWSLPGVLLLIGFIIAARIIRQRTRLLDQDEDPVDEDADILAAGEPAPRAGQLSSAPPAGAQLSGGRPPATSRPRPSHS